MRWPMGVLLSCESVCARLVVRRCPIGRNLARPVVIDVSASSASQLACCRVGNAAPCNVVMFKSMAFILPLIIDNIIRNRPFSVVCLNSRN
jgi:hypothetical protein